MLTYLSALQKRSRYPSKFLNGEVRAASSSSNAFTFLDERKEVTLKESSHAFESGISPYISKARLPGATFTRFVQQYLMSTRPEEMAVEASLSIISLFMSLVFIFCSFDYCLLLLVIGLFLPLTSYLY